MSHWGAESTQRSSKNANNLRELIKVMREKGIILTEHLLCSRL